MVSPKETWCPVTQKEFGHVTHKSPSQPRAVSRLEISGGNQPGCFTPVLFVGEFRPSFFFPDEQPLGEMLPLCSCTQKPSLVSA